MQQGTKPSAGLTFVKEDLTQATTAASMSAENGAARSLVMSDELLLNFVLPSFETVFIGRDIHRYKNNPIRTSLHHLTLQSRTKCFF